MCYSQAHGFFHFSQNKYCKLIVKYILNLSVMYYNTNVNEI